VQKALAAITLLQSFIPVNSEDYYYTSEDQHAWTTSHSRGWQPDGYTPYLFALFVIWLAAIYIFRSSTTSPSHEEFVASNIFPTVNEPDNTPEKSPRNFPFSGDAAASDAPFSSSSGQTYACHKMTESQTTYDTKLLQPRSKFHRANFKAYGLLEQAVLDMRRSIIADRKFLSVSLMQASDLDMTSAASTIFCRKANESGRQMNAKRM
jgi:hypothetical protein